MYYSKNTKRKTTKKERCGGKQSLKSLINKLDTTFSLFIRLRDSRPFGYKAFKCISCGQIKPFEEADAGHFIGRTHMSTRFDEQNVWCECRFDNRFNSSHMIEYQRNLEKKLGRERLDMLIARGHQTKKWTTWELSILVEHYKQENKKMLEERDSL